jgi:hypothetical protein
MPTTPLRQSAHRQTGTVIPRATARGPGAGEPAAVTLRMGAGGRGTAKGVKPA